MKRLLGLVATLLACATAPVAPPTPAPAPVTPAPIRLTLVGTNDLHGWVQPHRWTLADGTTLDEGGSAAFASYLSALRKDNPGGVLLLSAGDLFQGTLVSNLTEGRVVIDVYNRLGYQAAAIGNHEFDYGPVGPVSVAVDASVDPFGALKARIVQAKFPLLGVNLYDAKTGERPGWLGNDGTAIFEVHGVKVGVLGLTTPSTPYTTNPVNVASLHFGHLVPEAQAAAQRLRGRGAEVVIAVSHAGGKCASDRDPHDLSSCDRQDGEIFELLDGLPKGTLDAVVAGHTHAPLGHFIDGTPVIETSGMGRAFGVIELFVDPVTHKVLPEKTRIEPNIPICPVADTATHRCDGPFLARRKVHLSPTTFLGQRIVPDPAIETLLAPALARVEEEQVRKLGIPVPKPLGREYEQESALGDMLADSLRGLDHADIALLNPGGLRADLPAGELTFGEMYEVIPFDNTIATLSVSGAELERLLGAAYNGHKGVFQESGLKVELGGCPGPGRLKEVSLADGSPIDPARTYRVVVPDFLARGGDGLMPAVSSLGKAEIDLGMSRPLNFRDALIAYWQKAHATLAPPPPGRIRFLDSGTGCNAGARMDTQSEKAPR